MIRSAIPAASGTLRNLRHPPAIREQQAYPLLAYQSLHDPIAWRKGTAFVLSDFLAAVGELASRLPPRRHAVNLCKDRYHFLIAFAAALVSRHISLFPTCRATEVLEQLNDRYPESYILADHDDLPPGMPICPVTDGGKAVGASPDIPVIPSARIAAIVFTSGSSGLPKAHVKTWGSLVHGAEALARQLPADGTIPPVVVGTVPPQHMYGLETTIMLPLQQGWSMEAGHPILPADLHGDLAGLRIPVWLMTTPVHLRAYVGRKTALPGIERIVSATMPLARSLAAKAEQLWDVPVHEIYGCTEAGVIGSRRPTAGERWTLCPGLRLTQDGDTAWVSGGHVGEPFRLADRITVHQDGFLLHGSNYDLVKIAGKRASLTALNAALLRIDGVVDGTFYRPDEGRSTRLTAFVVAPGLGASMILNALRTRVDPVFLPRPLHLVDSLPRNSTGKLSREELEAFAAAYRPRRSVLG
jgi:acyl-coenzyme A synthetase/AMP-(fatty) acid ligase